MRLLGWMHRKLRQNSPTDTFKDFAIDRTSLDEPQNFGPRLSSTFSRPSIKSHASCFHRTSFAGLEEDDDPDADDELFRGLLAIGTLGSGGEFDIEGKPELENLPLNEVDQKMDRTYQSAIEGPDGSVQGAEPVAVKGNENGSGQSAPVCPLQGYLLGSPVVIPAPEPAEKKEQRTSLGELFQREVGKREDKREIEGDRAGVQRVKKKLSRRKPPASARSSTGSASGPVSDTTPVSGETKFHKILHIFHRKVHPESSSDGKPAAGSETYRRITSKIPCYRGDDRKGEQLLPADQHCILIQPTTGKKECNNMSCHCESNPSTFMLFGSESNGNREHWIRTDADYLVLEL